MLSGVHALPLCGAAGIAERPFQSRSGEIQLFPALARAWPTGSVKGLRARGGFELDIAWADGKLTSATIRSTLGGPCRVRSLVPLLVKTDGAGIQVERREENVVAFTTEPTCVYTLSPAR